MGVPGGLWCESQLRGNLRRYRDLAKQNLLQLGSLVVPHTDRLFHMFFLFVRQQLEKSILHGVVPKRRPS